MKVIDNSILSTSIPTVIITPEAYEKILQLIFATNLEVAWHGIVNRDASNNTYTITDILVYPQESQSINVESNDELYPLWLMELTNKQINTMRMQGHSHVNMPVNPSGTDRDYYLNMIKTVEDYYIFMIINKSEDLYLELYDVEQNIIYENNDIDLIIPDSWAKQEIAKNIIVVQPRKIRSKFNPIDVDQRFDNYYEPQRSKRKLVSK